MNNTTFNLLLFGLFVLLYFSGAMHELADIITLYLYRG